VGAHETAWVGFEFLQVCDFLAAGLLASKAVSSRRFSPTQPTLSIPNCGGFVKTGFFV